MFKYRTQLFALLCSSLLLLNASWAEDKLRMNMRDADIRALIQWVADNTGKNIVVHKDVKGNVTVISPEPLSSKDAYQVFLSVLDVHGYAAIDTEQALKIIPKNIATSGLALAKNSGSNADMVVSVIKIHNISAAKLLGSLRPLISKEAVISANPDSNSLIIADHYSTITHIRKLIAELDQAGDSEIELVKLKFANAADILNSLQSLVPATSGESQQLSLSMDERSNSLLIAGEASKRAQIKKLVAQLDTELMGDGNTQVIYLHYVDAKEMVPILKSLSSSIQSDKKESNSAISIESSVTTNALIINAPPAMLTTMKRVIQQVDIRRAQVLVEALVVEVSGDVGEDLGISWVSEDLSAVGDGLAGAVNTLGDLSAGGEVDGQFIPGRGMTFGYFNNGDLQAAIRALDATTKANILSTPTVVAIDNEEASLLVGQNVPFITGQSTGNASSTNNPFTTIERKDVGISLVVTPRINRGDSITLEIKQKTESIAPSLASASDLITNKREIITKALIKDGQMLVLGGLISDELTEKQEQVPILGSIPILGALFRSTSTDHVKKNLMVFIHPVILKDDQHINEITQRRYQFMQDLRARSQKQQWQHELKSNTQMDDFSTFKPSTPTM
ncbi:type II secretion system secretin GspD [Dasania marina]|uniref:type II secretion system secretin GspD n=1 Tax=Dasania marina TaxID=471499 RepID=UPI001F0AD7E1|nr:type II secretion system secretin GspD [Dasania marina]